MQRKEIARGFVDQLGEPAVKEPKRNHDRMGQKKRGAKKSGTRAKRRKLEGRFIIVRPEKFEAGA